MRTPSVRTPGLRGRLLASVAVGMALLLAALTSAFNVVLAHRLDGDAAGVAQARATATLASLSVSSGHIRLPDAPDERSPDARLWVFEGSTPIEQPRVVAPAEARAAAVLAGIAPAMRDVAATRIRLSAVPVVQSNRRAGAVVAGVSLAPYEQTRRTALVGSIVLALAVFAAVALAAARLISRALRPVARMTNQAADWSEHDLDRRFALGPARDEITQLACTLDTLLERLSASLRHEQRLSAELSHELRTPLASIAAEAQYALRHAELSADGREAVESILQSANRMAQTIDTLIAAARAELDPRRARSDAAACAQAAIDACAGEELSGVKLTLRPAPATLRVAVDQGLVERILAPLLENACRHACAAVEVVIAGDRSAVTFTVVDDGPGVSDEDIDAIFEPGTSTKDAATATIATGAGLGLALARRLARSAGGDVSATAGGGGGRFVVRLPAA